MSKHDYRYKRRVFQNKDVKGFQDFSSLKRQYIDKRRVSRTNRMLVVILLLIFLVLLMVATAFGKMAQENQLRKQVMNIENNHTAPNEIEQNNKGLI